MADPWSESDVQQVVRDTTTQIEYEERRVEIDKRRNHLKSLSTVEVPNVTDDDGGGSGAQYHDPKARRDANQYKRRILNAPLDIELAAVGDSDTAIEAAQSVKNAIQVEYARWRASGAFDGALFDMAGVHHGELALHLNLDVLPIVPQPEEGQGMIEYADKIAPILKEFAEGENADLFKLESVPCETVYDTNDGLARILAAKVPVGQLTKAYGKLGAGGYAGQKDASKAISVTDSGEISVRTMAGVEYQGGTEPWTKFTTLFIVSTAEYCYHFVQGSAASGDTLLGCYRNYFGVPQFFPVYADRTSEQHALYCATPLIDGLFEVMPFVNLFGTMIADSGIRQTQMRRRIKPAPGQQAEEDRRKAQGRVMVTELRGGYWKVTDGYEIDSPDESLGADVLNAFQNAKNDAALYGFPLVLAQPQELDATSGYDRAKAQDEVSAALDHPLEHWGDTLAAIFRARLTGQKNLGADVTIRNLNPSKKIGPVPQSVSQRITLKAAEIQDYDLRLSFDSTTTYTQISRQEMDLALFDKGMMNKREVLMRRGVEDIGRWYEERSFSEIEELANQDALMDAKALRDELRTIFSGEALEAAGLQGLAAAATGLAETMPMGGAQEGVNGAGPGQPAPTGATNLVAPEPNPVSEMGQTQGADTGAIVY